MLISGAYGNVGSCLMAGFPDTWRITGIDAKPGNDPRVLVGNIKEMKLTGLLAADFDVAIHLAADPDEAHGFANCSIPIS